MATVATQIRNIKFHGCCCVVTSVGNAIFHDGDPFLECGFLPFVTIVFPPVPDGFNSS